MKRARNSNNSRETDFIVDLELRDYLIRWKVAKASRHLKKIHSWKSRDRCPNCDGVGRCIECADDASWADWESVPCLVLKAINDGKLRIRSTRTWSAIEGIEVLI